MYYNNNFMVQLFYKIGHKPKHFNKPHPKIHGAENTQKGTCDLK